MNNTKHTAFVNGLKLLLHDDSKSSVSSLDDLFDEEDDCVCDDDAMKRLEKKFDELFGPIDDD